MGADAVFSQMMHVVCSDLNFDRLVLLGDYRCVERLVEIGLGHGNKVPEPGRMMRPFLMDGSQSRIAVFFSIGNEP